MLANTIAAAQAMRRDDPLSGQCLRILRRLARPMSTRATPRRPTDPQGPGAAGDGGDAGAGQRDAGRPRHRGALPAISSGPGVDQFLVLAGARQGRHARPRSLARSDRPGAAPRLGLCAGSRRNLRPPGRSARGAAAFHARSFRRAHRCDGPGDGRGRAPGHRAADLPIKPFRWITGLARRARSSAFLREALEMTWLWKTSLTLDNSKLRSLIGDEAAHPSRRRRAARARD